MHKDERVEAYSFFAYYSYIYISDLHNKREPIKLKNSTYRVINALHIELLKNMVGILAESLTRSLWTGKFLIGLVLGHPLHPYDSEIPLDVPRCPRISGYLKES